MTSNNENNTNKISSAVNSNLSKNSTEEVPKELKKNYYLMFFSIMIGAFVLMYWLCNYTNCRETFQIIMMAGFSATLAEYFSRKYLKF